MLHWIKTSSWINSLPSHTTILRYKSLDSLEFLIFFKLCWTANLFSSGRCFPEQFSAGFEPKYPTWRLPPSFLLKVKPRVSLPCFQGHRWLRFRGFRFSTVLPILRPEDHRALPSPGVFAEQRVRTEPPAERGFISPTCQSPGGERGQTLTRETWILPWKVFASCLSNSLDSEGGNVKKRLVVALPVALSNRLY